MYINCETRIYDNILYPDLWYSDVRLNWFNKTIEFLIADRLRLLIPIDINVYIQALPGQKKMTDHWKMIN